MKKLLCSVSILFAVVTACFAVPTAYNETHEENWSDLSYVQVPIYKVLDSKEAYVVIYAKNKIGAGSTVIPKSWIKGTKDSPRKLQIRDLKMGKLKPFMTVVKKNGEFHHVILNLCVNKSDSTWGVVANNKQLEGLDKETLEEIEL